MNNAQITNFCCGEHNEALIEARGRARIQNAELYTPEEIHAMAAIDQHLANIRIESDQSERV
jgi:hypothetical protein